MNGNEMVIVADPVGEPFGRAVADYLKCDYIPISISYFSDGEPDIEISKSIRGRSVYYFCPFYPDPLKRFAEVVLACDAIYYSSKEKLTLVPTYMGFMKKDFKDRPRVPISIRAAAETLDKYADKYITIGLHSPQIQGIFRKPFDHLDATVLFAKHIKEKRGSGAVLVQTESNGLSFVAADAGGIKQTRKLAGRLNVKDTATLYKIRDPNTRQVVAEGLMGNVKGKDTIIIEDQVASLETLSEAAAKLAENGARSIEAYEVHALMTEKNGVKAEDRLADSMIERLYVTDTIWRPKEYFDSAPKMGLVSAVELFAQAIDRDHKKLSVDDLFK